MSLFRVSIGSSGFFEHSASRIRYIICIFFAFLPFDHFGLSLFTPLLQADLNLVMRGVENVGPESFCGLAREGLTQVCKYYLWDLGSL